MAKPSSDVDQIPLFGGAPREQQGEDSKAGKSRKTAARRAGSAPSDSSGSSGGSGGSGAARGRAAPRARAKAPDAPPSRDGAAEQARKTPPNEPEVLTVAMLDRRIRQLLEGATAQVLVQGQVSGLHRAGSGHLYFTLKDDKEDAIIDCVMYRRSSARARSQIAEGESVVLRGKVTLYAPRGRMQLIADDVLQTARGALLEEFEELKKKLSAEGLFEARHKKSLPADPRRIAVLTSRDGAAIHDVIRVASRRGAAQIMLVPTPVQGSGAAERIARAIAVADALEFDVMIVTRGGGSAEDLAAYNDVAVVRAIFAAKTPVVSAVGHEVDVSLSDLVADARAATPSQAAELVVPDQAERLASLRHLSVRLRRAMQHKIGDGRRGLSELRAQLGEPRRLLLEQGQGIDELVARLQRRMGRIMQEGRGLVEARRRQLQLNDPRAVLSAGRLRLGKLEPALARAMRTHLERSGRQLVAIAPRLPAGVQTALEGDRRSLQMLAGRLDALSPLAVLARGYAIVSKDGRALLDAAQLRAGDEVSVRLHRGRFAAKVQRSEDD